MINCIFFFDSYKNFKEFSIEGHAESDQKTQVNILCTGISILSQSIILYFKNRLKIPISIDKKSGYLKCTILDSKKLDKTQLSQINLFILFFLESLKDLKKQYPNELHIDHIYSSLES